VRSEIERSPAQAGLLSALAHLGLESDGGGRWRPTHAVVGLDNEVTRLYAATFMVGGIRALEMAVGIRSYFATARQDLGSHRERLSVALKGVVLRLDPQAIEQLAERRGHHGTLGRYLLSMHPDCSLQAPDARRQPEDPSEALAPALCVLAVQGSLDEAQNALELAADMKLLASATSSGSSGQGPQKRSMPHPEDASMEPEHRLAPFERARAGAALPRPTWSGVSLVRGGGAGSAQSSPGAPRPAAPWREANFESLETLAQLVADAPPLPVGSPQRRRKTPPSATTSSLQPATSMEPIGSSDRLPSDPAAFSAETSGLQLGLTATQISQLSAPQCPPGTETWVEELAINAVPRVRLARADLHKMVRQPEFS
jgi:hypothetical protein